MSRILILGGGFAGITAAEVLSEGAAAEHEITVVSPSRKLTFFPALVPMVFGDFLPEELRTDVVAPLHERRVRFIEGEVLTIDPVSRNVRVTGDDIDGELRYDYLLIAIGRRLATETVPGFFENAHHLLGINAGIRFRHAVSEFGSGSIVVGLCPGSSLPVPVCESALALADRFEREIAEKRICITAVFPETLEEALAGTGLFRHVEESLQQKGVSLVQNFPVARVEEGTLQARNTTELAFDLAMLFPPFRGQTAIRELGSSDENDGFAVVNSRMQLEGHEKIYAAGDIIALDGPRFGYMAMRQAKVAAANILIELSGEEPNIEYSHELAWILGEDYTDPHFFHYGVWDETLQDFDENALLGMARRVRERYGHIRTERNGGRDAAALSGKP
ncbi:MAG: FAD-dependent oxidoreductase [Acidobacteria bacterium]|nr:FAD-dependent oxidoreductase [Acidobacteriota bacterium]